MENGASKRQLQVARELQKDLAEIIRSKGMAAFGGAMVSVTEVRISPDLSVAKVYLSVFPSSKAEAVMEQINENGRALRGELGQADENRAGAGILPGHLPRLCGAHRGAPKKIA